MENQAKATPREIMNPYQKEVKKLEKVSKLCGYDVEELGGWNLGWFIPIKDGKEITFGFANGPLGYCYGSQDGEVFEADDMPKSKMTIKGMADYISATVNRIKAQENL